MFKLKQIFFLIATFFVTHSVTAGKIDSLQVSKRLKTIDADFFKVNATVVSIIQKQLSTDKKKTEEFLDRSGSILPVVSQEISASHLPVALQYLPAAVSQFNQFNMTEHGVGIWNLPYIIGRRYGLQIDHDIDERRDISKSTIAAISYLKDLQKQYNNWYLSIFAFVSSPSELNSRLMDENELSFVALYSSLSESQQEYYNQLVSAAYVCNFYHEHQLSKTKQVANNATTQITAQNLISIKDMLARIGMSEFEFLSYNLSLRGNNIPSGFSFYLPNNKIAVYESIKDSLVVSRKLTLAKDSTTVVTPKVVEKTETKTNAPVSKTIYHKVKSGDTVWGICKKYNITESKLKAHNKINGNNIQIGQSLKIVK